MIESGNTPIGTLQTDQTITLKGVDGDWWLLEDGRWITSASISFGKECRSLPLAAPKGTLFYPPGSPLAAQATANATSTANAIAIATSTPDAILTSTLPAPAPATSTNLAPTLVVAPMSLTLTTLAVQPLLNASETQDAALAFEQGMIAKQQDDIEQAIAFFNRAIQLNSDFADAYKALGDVYFVQEDFALANSLFSTYRELTALEDIAVVRAVNKADVIRMIEADMRAEGGAQRKLQCLY
jgi:tetratricopeptide (TPR) repeat protein